MGGNTDRLTRVNELLKREIGTMLQRDFSDGGVLVSVTMVRCSVDLREALVYLSCFGGQKGDHQQILHNIQHRRGEYQRQLARVLAFKNTPVLRFDLDERIAAGDRVLQILQELEAENEQSGN